MEKVTYRISLDVNKNGIQKTIQGIETGDRYARDIRITLRNGREDYEIAQDVEAIMYVRQPGAENPSINECEIVGNEIIYTVHPEDVAQIGTTIMQLKLIATLKHDKEIVLIAPRFALEVWESETDDSAAEATTTYTALERAIADAKTYYNERITGVVVEEDYTIKVTFANDKEYTSDAFKTFHAEIEAVESEMASTEAKLDSQATSMATSLDSRFNSTSAALTSEIASEVSKIDSQFASETAKIDSQFASESAALTSEIASTSAKLTSSYASTASSLSAATSEIASEVNVIGSEVASVSADLSTKADKVNPTTSGAMLHKGTSEFKKHMTGYTAEFVAITSDEVGTDMLNANYTSGIIVGAKMLLNHDASLNYTDGSGIKHKISSVGSVLHNSNIVEQRLETKTEELQIEIDELKNKSGASLILASASPLPNTTASNIIGIDVSGKSEQETTKNVACVQGGLTSSSVGYSINQAVKSNTTRCVTDVFAMTNGGTITVSSGYQFYTLHAETEDGLIDEVTGWRTSLTLSKSGYYRFLIKNDGGTDLTPSQFTLTAEGITPTPTNPIPIIDASTEVSAIEVKNLDSGFEQGGIGHTTNANYSANKVSSSTRIRIAELMPTVSGQIYTFTCNSSYKVIVQSFNESGMLVDTNGSNAWNNPLTVTASASMGIAVCKADNSNITPPDIENANVIMKGGQSNTITLPYTLRSVGTVADELIVNKDGSGKLMQNVERKKFSELGYNAYDSGNTRFVFNVSNVMIAAARTLPMLCDCYNAITDGRTIADVPTNSVYASGDGTRLYVHDYSTTDGSTLLASIGNMYVYYPLQNPIITDLTAEQVSSILALKTYDGTTIIDAELDVNSVSYSADVKGYVDDAIAEVNAKDEYLKADVYIGKYYDGSNVYRRIVTFTSGTSGHNPEWMSSIPSGCIPIRWEGVLKADNGVRYPINYFEDGSNFIATYFDNERIYNKVNGSKFSTKPIEMIVEYLKSNSRMTEPMLLSEESEGGEE